MQSSLYKPVALCAGVLGGLAARAAFERVWTSVSDDEDTPDPKRADDTWTRVLVAAAIEGVIYALVKATLERSTAIGFARATGSWPED
jgi:hypothetical protein